MNKRGFLATLAAICVAPAAGWAAINKPKTFVWWNSMDSFMRLNGRWWPVADLETIPEDDRDHVGEAPHEHEAYVEIRIGKWRQAVCVVGSADPIECVKSALAPDTLLTDWIEEELTYPDSVLHTIRAESKAAVAERSVRILPR